MKDHSHPEPKKCKHRVEFCEACDRPYCKSCGQEWQALASQWTFTTGSTLKGLDFYPNATNGNGITWTVPQTVTTNPAYPPNTVLCAH